MKDEHLSVLSKVIPKQSTVSVRNLRLLTKERQLRLSLCGKNKSQGKLLGMSLKRNITLKSVITHSAMSLKKEKLQELKNSPMPRFLERK